jgi:hypothetical protein
MLRHKPIAALALSVLLLLTVVGLGSTVAVQAATVPVFGDGFESGNLQAWTTSKGILAEQTLVSSGSWASRAATVKAPGYASKTLSPSRIEVSFSARVNLQSVGSTVTLLRMRPAGGAGIVSLKVNKSGKLLLRNEIAATTRTSATVLPRDAWHSLALHVVVNGSSSLLEVSLDGGLVTDLSGTSSLGTGQIGRLQIGNTGAGTMDVAFDDVEATAPGTTQTDPVVTAAGDICPVSPTNCTGTASLILSLDPDLALTLGDNQYTNGTLAQYQASYDLQWGKFKARTRPAPGNHEWYTANAQGYRDYFGTGVLTNGGTWYSYNLGAWHLVSLDSSCTENGGCDPGSAQYTWLQQDLANDQHACTLAYWHHPRFSSGDAHGSSTTVQPLWGLLETEGAEIVLSGHDHVYERFAPQTGAGAASPSGIRQFVVGTGGASADGFAATQPNSEVRIATTKGVLELTLATSGYSWRFLNVTGAVLDAGTSTCH